MSVHSAQKILKDAEALKDKVSEKELIDLFAVIWRNKVKLGHIPIELNGHFRNYQFGGDDNHDSYFWSELCCHFMRYGDRSLYHALANVHQGIPNTEIFEECKENWLCTECGQHLNMKTDGLKIWCENPCSMPDGLPDFSVELDIPSGFMVFGNDFRSHPSHPEKNWQKGWDEPIAGYFSVNYAINRQKLSELYAQAGLVFLFCGDVGVHVFHMQDGNIWIGSMSDVPGEMPTDRIPCGRIITDLHWYCVADLEKYKSVLGVENVPTHSENQWRNRGFKIAVPPGRYRFTHEFERHNPVFDCTDFVPTITKIELIK